MEKFQEPKFVAKNEQIYGRRQSFSIYRIHCITNDIYKGMRRKKMWICVWVCLLKQSAALLHIILIFIVGWGTWS